MAGIFFFCKKRASAYLDFVPIRVTAARSPADKLN
jgi:hypothetical protein